MKYGLPQKNDPAYRANARYVAITAGAVVFSWLLHEWAHWAMGQALGYDMAMTLNKSYPVPARYSGAGHYAVVSAAGPAVTLLEALVDYVLLRQRWRLLLYPFLFTCLYMRLFALVISIRR